MWCEGEQECTLTCKTITHNRNPRHISNATAICEIMEKNFNSMQSQLGLQDYSSPSGYFQIAKMNSQYNLTANKIRERFKYNFFELPKTYSKNRKTANDLLFMHEEFFQKSYHRSLGQDIRGLAKGRSLSRM
eukprot:TRINITY_DN7706_c0_g1_i20.p1 TRINITY_DN7706_c0_g1~~TRINITY_DN7706_c0_g1_i20.p1  ORF type:complete len:132 (+),score=8.91 TRINITY_DN7706_c0_g1_i20:233-628(+)